MAAVTKKRFLRQKEMSLTMAIDAVIAKRGDVLLQLSKDGKAAGTLLVSSQVLSLASPVFEAMFNGDFAEGQNLSAASPTKIPLPDDDPESMTLLCRLTHMQADVIPGKVSFDRLAEFAVVCDKYQCTDAVLSWSRIQIAQCLPDPNAFMFEKLIFITYTLNLPHEFKLVCKRVIRDRAGTFSYRIASHDRDSVPLGILDHINGLSNAQLSAVRSALFPKKYHELIMSGCSRASTMLKAYLGGLTQAGIPVDKTLSIAEYAKCAAILERQSMGAPCPEHAHCAVILGKELKQEVAAALLSVYDNVHSCCLDCLRKSIGGEKDLKCRLGHTPVMGAVPTSTGQSL